MIIVKKVLTYRYFKILFKKYLDKDTSPKKYLDTDKISRYCILYLDISRFELV